MLPMEPSSQENSMRSVRPTREMNAETIEVTSASCRRCHSVNWRSPEFIDGGAGFEGHGKILNQWLVASG